MDFRPFLIIPLLILALGLGYIIGADNMGACPDCLCSSYNQGQDLNFLPYLVARYDEVLPWDNQTNFTCLPRALSFEKEAEAVGYEVEVMYGCREEGLNKSCHAWPRIYIDVWGSRENYPDIPDNDIINYWLEAME